MIISGLKRILGADDRQKVAEFVGETFLNQTVVKKFDVLIDQIIDARVFLIMIVLRHAIQPFKGVRVSYIRGLSKSITISGIIWFHGLRRNI